MIKFIFVLSLVLSCVCGKREEVKDALIRQGVIVLCATKERNSDLSVLLHGVWKKIFSRRRPTIHVYLRQRYLKKTQASIQEYIIASFYMRTLYFIKVETFLCVSKHGITIVQLAILTATGKFHGRFYFLKGKHSVTVHTLFCEMSGDLHFLQLLIGGARISISVTSLPDFC